MTRPTDEELSIALKHAAFLREQGEDSYFLGKSLLNHNYRLEKLKLVMDAASHFLHSGEGAREHLELIAAIKEARKTEYRSGEEPEASEVIVI